MATMDGARFDLTRQGRGPASGGTAPPVTRVAVSPPPAPTRVTVNLTPRAVDALERTCGRTGDNKTDVINHALQVLEVVHDLLERNDGRSLVILQSDGRCERVYLL